MIGATGSLLPIFLLIGLGYALKRTGLDDDRVWRGLDTLAYRVLLPALLLRGLVGANLAEVPVAPALALGAVAVLATTALAAVARGRTRLSNAAFTSVIQGGIHPNAYLAVAAVMALYGEDGVSSAALGVAAFIPIAKIVATAALVRFGKGRRRDIVRTVIFDPLILACVAGVLINLGDSGLPDWLDATMALLARAALPLGLLATGAALAFDGLRRRIGAILMASTAKFAVLPGLVWAGLRLTGITGADAGALLLFAVAPASISAYVLARQSGGDHRLMTGIMTFQTVAAGAVLPIWLGAVGAL